MTFSKCRTALLVLLLLLALPDPGRAQGTCHVLVDAGHGGHDLGAVSGGLHEKEVALDFAKRLAKELILQGFEVSMTRETDVFIPLDERAREGERRGADLFVSVHANAAPSPSLRGFEVYYFSPEEDDSKVIAARALQLPPATDAAKFDAPSQAVLAVYWDLRLAEAKRQARSAAGHLENAVKSSIYTSTRRLRSADFRVLKWAGCPSILVETGYLTNRDDNRLLRSPIYRTKLARAVADGLARYRDSEGKGKL